MPRLLRRDYAYSADTLAPALLGCTLVRILPDGTRLVGTIVETEAYLGPDDRAAHSFGNRRTARTEPMFGPAGTSYVYFSYGMHWCMNVVAAEPEVPQAVLLRAIQPTEGLARIREYRTGSKPRKTPLRDRDLCSGPGKIGQAFALDRAQSGLDLTQSDRLWLEPAPEPTSSDTVRVSPRIGIDNAGVRARRHLRYFLCGHPHVSGRRIPGRPWTSADPG
ncbi:MAG: DNA-3-methyladenine glycosylase [Phycisphaerales bacterium]